MSVTVYDIARQLHLSQPAVSQILNGKGRFSAATRKRVLDTAGRLGWRPNASARTLSAGRFGAIGLVVSDLNMSSMLPEGLMDEVEMRLHPRGEHLVYARLPDHALSSPEQTPKLLRQLFVDGLLIGYNAGMHEGFHASVMATGLPVVWINSDQPSACVRPDDRQGARDAVRLLHGLGHRRIAYLNYTRGPGEPGMHYSQAERLDGYVEGMAEVGLPGRFLGLVGGVPPGSRVAFTRAWMAGPDRPTALVCYASDHIGVVQVAAAVEGLRLPQDLSLIMFAFKRGKRFADLAIGTCFMDPALLAAEALTLLDEQRAGGPPGAPRRIPVRICAGESCVAPSEPS